MSSLRGLKILFVIHFYKDIAALLLDNLTLS